MTERADDDTQIRVLDGTSRRHEDSPRPQARFGSALLEIAQPSIPAEHEANLRTLANILDAVPDLARQIRDVTMDSGASTTAGVAPTTDPPPVVVKASRWPVVALLIVSVFSGALIFASALGVVWELRDIRQATTDQESRVARAEGERGELRRQTEERERVTRSEIAALEAKTEANSERIALLTEHMISRLNLIGEATGANKMKGWGDVPADLALVVAQRKAAEARGG